MTEPSIGVAPPALAPLEQRYPDPNTASAVGSGSRGLLSWLSAGVVVAGVATAIVAARPKERAPGPAQPAAPAPVQSLSASQPVGAPSSVTPGSAPEYVRPATPPTSEVPVTSPSARSRPTQSAADIQEQIALIDAARAAVAARSSKRALGLVRQYQSKYPSGSFRPEAAALKIEALTQLGRNAEARGLADGFAAEYGGGPLADRVSRLKNRAGP